jgi:hypothetical protein
MAVELGYSLPSTTNIQHHLDEVDDEVEAGQAKDLSPYYLRCN